MSRRFQVNPLVVEAATRKVDANGFRRRMERWLAQQAVRRLLGTHIKQMMGFSFIRLPKNGS